MPTTAHVAPVVCPTWDVTCGPQHIQPAVTTHFGYHALPPLCFPPPSPLGAAAGTFGDSVTPPQALDVLWTHRHSGAHMWHRHGSTLRKCFCSEGAHVLHQYGVYLLRTHAHCCVHTQVYRHGITHTCTKAWRCTSSTSVCTSMECICKTQLFTSTH